MRIVEPWELGAPEPDRYCLGLDLGQVSDFTAIAVGRWRTDANPRTVDVVYLERLALGSSYPDQVEYVSSLLLRPPLSGGADLVVDQTGVGRAVVDLLRDLRLNPIGVTITAGQGATREGRDWRVPKADLVGAVQVGLQSRKLRIAADLAHADTLRDELGAFEVRVTTAAHETYNGRSGVHDDLVLAVALTCWWVSVAPAPAMFW